MASRFSQGLKTLGTDEPRKRAAPAKKAQDVQEASAAPEVRTEATPPAQEPQDAGARYTAPSRIGKKAVTGYFDPAVRQQLAVLAAEEDRSQNDLIAEALNMLFERYRKSPIARG